MKGQSSLLALAKEFVDGYIRKFSDEILGAVLVGSASFGISDEFADIDIFVYADEETVRRRKAYGKGYNETYKFKGVEVCVDWNSIEKLEEIVGNLKDDESLWVFHNAKILYDPKGLMRKLLKRMKSYPENLRREKIFLHFYYTKAFLENCKKTILREDFLTTIFLMYKAVDEITYLTYILEGSYVPYPKWRLTLMKKTKLGKNMLPKIEEILCVKQLTREELTLKLQKLNKIVENLKPHLHKANIPEKWLGPQWWKHEPNWHV
jgi:predicted nucleotidyltransferase